MPRYFTSTGAIDGEPITLLASAEHTADGNGPAVPTDGAHTLRLTLDITAATAGTGSPTLTVNVQTSADGTTWSTHTSFAAATAVGTQRKALSGLDRFVRCSWTLAGTTPSATFSVAGERL